MEQQQQQHYGNFDIFPKELKVLILLRLNSCSLGRVLQLNKAFSMILDALGVWKHKCVSEWRLSPESTRNCQQNFETIN